MSIDESMLKSSIDAFEKVYPFSKEFKYFLIHNAEAAYGENSEGIQGGFISKNSERKSNEVHLVINNIKNEKELFTVLKHEILGHYSINTFSPKNKKLLLESISEPNHDSLKNKKDFINIEYAGKSDLIKSEEVYAFVAEEVFIKEIPPNINAKALESFDETCVKKSRDISTDDIKNITEMVALGLHQDKKTANLS